MAVPFIAPTYQSSSFNCPYCMAFAEQVWKPVYNDYQGHRVSELDLSYCAHCGKYAVWYGKSMVVPEYQGVEPPNPDLLAEIQSDYLEAAQIVNKSPRGAAALLRLAVQKLCKQLGQPGKDINADIGALVKDGLSVKIQQALDTVRVTGNEAVHPGFLDLKDDIDTTQKLFRLINFIAEKMLTEPKIVEQLFDSLPESKKGQIAERDSV